MPAQAPRSQQENILIPFLTWLEGELMAISPGCFCCAGQTPIQSQNTEVGEGTWAALYREPYSYQIMLPDPTPNREPTLLLLYTEVVSIHSGGGLS